MASSAVESNVRLARRIPEDVATEGNLDLIDEICAEDVVDHGPFGESTGREEFKRNVEMLREAFSGFAATVEETIAEGDAVAMRVTLSGTHTGEFMGVEPTDREFSVSNAVFTHIEDGKIVERYVLPDTLSMMRQLGAIESFER